MTKPMGGTTLNSHFWQQYEECLIYNSINAKLIRWYVSWCQHFVKFINPRPLGSCQPEHVSAFLDNLRSNPKIEDWQCQQARTALWYLFYDHLEIGWASRRDQSD